MALSSTMVWEVRSTATAGNVNGGGFNPSNAAGNTTDYSQQNAAQYTGTDLASSNGTNATPTVTSASHTFVSTDVGNIIFISAGTNWTAGRYEITSVSGGGAVLDRACGSVAALSSGTYAVGGALSLGSSDDTVFETFVAGNKIHIKSGTYTLGGAISVASAGGAQNPITIEGYNTTRGDNPTGTSRPTLDGGANAITFTGANWNYYNMIFTSTGGNCFVNSLGSKFFNCKFANTSTVANRQALTIGATSGNVFCLNCEFVSYRGNGVSLSAVAHFIGCYFHDSNNGVSDSVVATGGQVFTNCVFANCVNAAYNGASARTGGLFINNCTFYGAENKLGTGITFATGTTSVRLMNNIIYGFVTGVNHADSAQRIGLDDYNNYYNNTTDANNWIQGTNTISLNPNFRNVTQITGTTATTSGSVLTDSSADFSNVVDNQDYCHIKSGTGVTAGIYKITAHTTTTLTLDIAPGTSATADKVYQVTTGRNWAVGPNMKDQAFPGTFADNLVTSYSDIGAIQRPFPTVAHPFVT
jgi:hypothetical protein